MTFSWQRQWRFQYSMMLQRCNVDHRFEWWYCFHLPGQAVQEQSSWAPRSCIWRHYDHSKRLQLLTSRHSVLSQKTWIFPTYPRCQNNQGTYWLNIQGSPPTQESFEGASCLYLQDNPSLLIIPWKWIPQHPGIITPIHTAYTSIDWNLHQNRCEHPKFHELRTNEKINVSICSRRPSGVRKLQYVAATSKGGHKLACVSVLRERFVHPPATHTHTHTHTIIFTGRPLLSDKKKPDTENRREMRGKFHWLIVWKRRKCNKEQSTR